MDSSTETYKLTGLELDRVDLVTAGANPGAHVLIHKFETPDIVEETPVSDAVEETVEAPEAPVEEVAMSEETPVETAPQADVVAKADFEALQKANVSLVERIEKMERDRKQAEFIAKAKDLDNLGAADQLGNMLLEASEGMSPEAYQMLERTLKAANAQVEKGALFAQFSQPEGDAVPVMDRINDLAKAKVAAGEARTIEIAKQMVIKENPALRDEYVAARSSR